MKACLRGQTLLYSLSYNLLFYLTNSPARNKQNKPQKAVCARVCICLYVWFCWRAFVCLCVAERVESGYCQAVYLIEKPALWSRAAGSISQRYASFLQFCIFLQTLRYTYVYVHQASMHSHKQCLLVYIPPTWSRHPFKVSNEIPLFSSAVLSLGYCSWQDRCIFTWKLLLLQLQLGFVSLLSC